MFLRGVLLGDDHRLKPAHKSGSRREATSVTSSPPQSTCRSVSGGVAHAAEVLAHHGGPHRQLGPRYAAALGAHAGHALDQEAALGPSPPPMVKSRTSCRLWAMHRSTFGSLPISPSVTCTR